MDILNLSEWLSRYKGISYKQYRHKSKNSRGKLRQEYEEYVSVKYEEECLYTILAEIGVPFLNGEPIGIG